MRKIGSGAWSRKGNQDALPPGTTFVAAGDSITAQGTFSTSDTTDIVMLSRGYWTWAYNASGVLRPISGVNAGVGGNTAAQLLTRYPTDVIAKAPGLVFLHIGTNDLVSINRAAVDIIADIDAMLVLNRSIRARTILLKVLPRGSIASPMSAPQIVQWILLNNFIAARAASDCLVVDAESAIGNMDANHTMLPGMSSADDFLHPNNLCAQRVGARVAAAVARMVAPGNGLFTYNDPSGNFVPNGFMIGSAGSVAGGATGQVTTGWAATAALMGGGAMACSKAPRAAGGEWQQVAMSGTYTGIAQLSDISKTFAMVATTGQKLTIEADIQVDAGVVGLGSTSLLAQFDDGSSVDVMNISGAENASLEGPYSGLFRSVPCIAVAPITSCTLRLRNYLTPSAGASPVAATVRVGGLGIKLLAA